MATLVVTFNRVLYRCVHIWIHAHKNAGSWILKKTHTHTHSSNSNHLSFQTNTTWQFLIKENTFLKRICFQSLWTPFDICLRAQMSLNACVFIWPIESTLGASGHIYALFAFVFFSFFLTLFVRFRSVSHVRLCFPFYFCCLCTSRQSVDCPSGGV